MDLEVENVSYVAVKEKLEEKKKGSYRINRK